jgi:hypothetical protein
MHFPARLTVLASLVVLASCTSDLPAPDVYATSDASDSDTATTGVPGQLDVNCGSPADGAVDADYSFTPPAPSGGVGPFIWNGALSPLAIDGATGTISGIPEMEGTISGTITVTDSEGSVGMAGCDITVHPKVTSGIPNGKASPCLVGGEQFGDFLVAGTGDGTSITCTVATGSGNGKLPSGVTVNPDTCVMEGSVTESDYGTWVWIVEADQNGAKTYLPYCASNATPDNGTYNITAFHGGNTMTNNVLIPGRGTFTPGQPIAFGDTAADDPVFEITDASCGNPCFFGFSFFINGSPFDGATFGLQPAALMKNAADMNIGFNHHLSVTGPAVSASFADRPWVMNSSLDYCISDQDGPCNGSANVIANGNANLEFAIVMFPG